MHGERLGPYVIMDKLTKETSGDEDSDEWQDTAPAVPEASTPAKRRNDDNDGDGSYNGAAMVAASAAAAAVAYYIAAGARRAST